MSAARLEREAASRHVAPAQRPQRVHPEVPQAMHELGIGLADRRPQLLTRELAE